MARVAALIGDLMFGSKVKALLETGGHEVDLVVADVRPWSPAAREVDVLVVDLVSAPDGAGLLERLRADGGLRGVPALATYSHVDGRMRARARDAGFDLVVPRSRMMREGADLVSGLVRP